MGKNIEQNVIVAVFNVESEGYQALTELKQSAASETYFVTAAALVKKEGKITTVVDGFDTGADTVNDTMIGGLVGMMLGIFGGPLGVLLGGSYGALVGATVDAGEAVFGVSMLEQIADRLDDGMVAIVALAGEESEEALDTKLAAFDTVIARFDAETVAEEVDRAYEKQYEMARQAKLDLRKERKEEIAEKISVAADKLDNALDAAKERDEKVLEDLKENEETLRHGFTK